MYYSRNGERRGLTRFLGACLVRENGSGRVRRTVSWVNGGGVVARSLVCQKFEGLPRRGKGACGVLANGGVERVDLLVGGGIVHAPGFQLVVEMKVCRWAYVALKKKYLGLKGFTPLPNSKAHIYDNYD